jgi:hypothetical protein
VKAMAGGVSQRWHIVSGSLERENGRWLYVTCGIVAETGMLKLNDARGASPSDRLLPQPQFSIALPFC